MPQRTLQRRRLLVLAYYVPPLGGSGVQRITKLLKYLPEAGWDATLVAPRPGRYVVRDASLLDDLDHGGVEVIRTPSLDPSRIGRGEAGSAPYGDTQRRVAGRVTGWLFLPDNKIGWLPFAVRAGRAALAKTPHDAILSTAPPYTAHLAAARLGSTSGLPVVLDYRDDWLGNPRHVYPTPWHRRAHARLEAYALRRAALVTTINETIAEALRQRASGLAPVAVLPQGFDPADLDAPPAPRDPRTMRFVYTGVFYEAQRPDVFLDALSRVQRELGPGRMEAVFAGLVPPDFDARVAALGLTEHVRYAGYLPHRASVSLARSADVLWMTVGEQVGSAQISTSKLFEYMGTGRPILALVPPGEAADALARYRAAAVVSPADVGAVAEALRALYQAWTAGTLPRPDEAYLARHDRQTLAHEMGALLDGVVARRGAAAR